MSYLENKYKTPWNKREPEEGGGCVNSFCKGRYEIAHDGACYCSATNNPPCSRCENSYLECNECGESGE